MREEFAVYGLPVWFMRLVNVAKLLLAALLLSGVWMSDITRPAAFGILILMVGAVLMHFRVGDPVRKALPASALMVLSLSLVVLQ